MAVLHRLRNGGDPLRHGVAGHRRVEAGCRRIAGSLLAGLVLLVAACGEPERPSDPELAAALGLDPGHSIHRIDLGGRGSIEHVVPSKIDVDPGDVVQFVAVDGRIHTVDFLLDSIGPEAGRFLRSTGQDASPPLVQRGARFVVSFEGAPPGDYFFVSQGNADPAVGLIRVGARSR